MKNSNFHHLLTKALLIIEEFEVYETLTEITVALCNKTITQDEGVTILKIVMEKHAPIDSFR
jgi:hypothetical protein